MAIESNREAVRLTTSQAQAVKSALQQWSKAKLINPSLIPNLLTTIQIVEEDDGFPWQQFAKYAFRIAVICFILAILSIIFDNVFPKLIERFLDLPIALRVTTTVCAAVAVHAWGYQRSLIKPEEPYLNEAIHCLGALIFALAALQLGHYLECSRRENRDILNWILIALASTYCLVGAMVNSSFIWSCGMILIGTWLGFITGRHSEVHYLGHTIYRFRFLLLGMATICTAYLMRRFQYTVELWPTTRIWGMLYLFNTLWVLSLPDLFPEFLFSASYTQDGVPSWFLVLFLASAFSIWHGFMFRDSTTHGFGLVYFSINLFMKYCELYWNAWYTPAFFIVLALSLALLGRYAEHMNTLLQE
ncbi:hypothetical protein F4781DRAFT_408921 [Annulohypoxylon bovei var. microspora]|nr:hypothetical protein F4781DRAFT_408921 [Annulohypoxylon bovei var. microspora]